MAAALLLDPWFFAANDNRRRPRGVLRLIRAADADDSLFGITSEAEPMGTVTYGYDAYGRRNSLVYPTAGGGSALAVTYGYDNAGRMTTVAENGVTLATYTYDPLRLLSLSRANGVTTTYGYYNTANVFSDPLWRLSNLTTTLASGSAGDDISLGLGYTAVGQLKSRLETLSAPTTAQPNPGAAGSGYLYSPTSPSTTYAINGLNQIASTSAGPAFTYDPRGNLTSDGTTTYGYNANNLLTGTGAGGPYAGASLAYDADNRLLKVTSGAGTTSQFLYDGVKMITEYNGSGTLLRRYIDGPATDDPLVWYEGTGTNDPRFYAVDEQGSVINLSNINGNTYLNGSAKMIFAYDEYGVPGPANLGRYSYTGQVWLPEVGLYYYKARVYSPTLGRFMQTDPIGYKDGMNWYAYVGDDPVDKTDPTGQDEINLFVAIAPVRDPAAGGIPLEHEAKIVGSGKNWTYMSKDGSAGWDPAAGPSKWTIKTLGSESAALQYAANQKGYTSGYFHAETPVQDSANIAATKKQILSDYNVCTSNCGQAAAAGDRAAGLPTYSGSNPDPAAAKAYFSSAQGQKDGWVPVHLPSPNESTTSSASCTTASTSSSKPCTSH